MRLGIYEDISRRYAVVTEANRHHGSSVTHTFLVDILNIEAENHAVALMECRIGIYAVVQDVIRHV